MEMKADPSHIEERSSREKKRERGKEELNEKAARERTRTLKENSQGMEPRTLIGNSQGIPFRSGITVAKCR